MALPSRASEAGLPELAGQLVSWSPGGLFTNRASWCMLGGSGEQPGWAPGGEQCRASRAAERCFPSVILGSPGRKLDPLCKVCFFSGSLKLQLINSCWIPHPRTATSQDQLAKGLRRGEAPLRTALTTATWHGAALVPQSQRAHCPGRLRGRWKLTVEAAGLGHGPYQK